MSLLGIVTLFALCVVVIVVSGTRLSYYGDVIAERSGLGQAWVGVIAMASVTSLPELVTGGTAFVALSTSLPEVVVSIAAMRLGAWDMAVANVLGSNMFNVAILAVDDLFFTDGPPVSAIAPGHAITAIAAAGMSVIIIAGLVAKPPRLFSRVSWTLVGLVAIYVLANILAF